MGCIVLCSCVPQDNLTCFSSSVTWSPQVTSYPCCRQPDLSLLLLLIPFVPPETVCLHKYFYCMVPLLCLHIFFCCIMRMFKSPSFNRGGNNPLPLSPVMSLPCWSAHLAPRETSLGGTPATRLLRWVGMRPFPNGIHQQIRRLTIIFLGLPAAMIFLRPPLGRKPLPMRMSPREGWDTPQHGCEV